MTLSTNTRGLIVTAMMVVSAIAASCDSSKPANDPGGTGGSPLPGTGGARTGGAGGGIGGAPAVGGNGNLGGAPGAGGKGGGGGAAGGAGGGVGGGGGAVACTIPGTQPLYVAPGCGANAPAPTCILNYLCIGSACSCDGKIISGCHAFPVPYGYEYPLGVMPTGGVCDPDKPPR